MLNVEILLKTSFYTTIKTKIKKNKIQNIKQMFFLKKNVLKIKLFSSKSSSNTYINNSENKHVKLHP